MLHYSLKCPKGALGTPKGGEEDPEHVTDIGGGEDVGASVAASMGGALSAIGDTVPHTSPHVDPQFVSSTLMFLWERMRLETYLLL